MAIATSSYLSCGGLETKHAWIKTGSIQIGVELSRLATVWPGPGSLARTANAHLSILSMTPHHRHVPSMRHASWSGLRLSGSFQGWIEKPRPIVPPQLGNFLSWGLKIVLSDVRPSKVSLLIVIPVVSLCLLFSYLFHLHSNLTKAEKYVFADFCTRATATFQRFTPFACFSAWHLFATCLCSLKSLATKRFVPNRHVVKNCCF